MVKLKMNIRVETLEFRCAACWTNTDHHISNDIHFVTCSLLVLMSICILRAPNAFVRLVLGVKDMENYICSIKSVFPMIV